MKDPAERPESSGAPLTPVQRIARFALLTPLQWFMTLIATMVIAAGALFLTLAWQIGPQVALRHHAYARFTATADARVVDSWVAVELDPAQVRSADNWRASARASPCAIVEIEGNWTADRTRGFCGNRFSFNDAYDLVTLRELAPGVPFFWRRDERGFVVTQLRMAEPARDYLATHAVDKFMHKTWPADNALDWLKLELDRPVDAAVVGWTAAEPTMRVVYDPAHPDAMLPAGIVQSRTAQRTAWILPVVIGAIGLAVWTVGMQLLPALGNFNALGRIVMTVAPLLTLPWWSDDLPRGLAAFSRPVGEIVEDMLADFDPLDRLLATAPDAATLVRGTRIEWRAGDGPYAETFGPLHFERPRTPYASDDEALAALAQTVTRQMDALDAAVRAERFDAWRRAKQLDLLASGIVAIPAARAALVDPDPDARVRRAAGAFLLAWTTSPTDTADPHRPAFHERERLRASLADVPVPEIANMVK